MNLTGRMTNGLYGISDKLKREQAAANCQACTAGSPKKEEKPAPKPNCEQ